MKLILLLIFQLCIYTVQAQSTVNVELYKTVYGNISPKSVNISNTGTVIAQNMMYKHTCTAYDREGVLLNTISDEVDLGDLNQEGNSQNSIITKGAPVEGAFSFDGKYYWVSNYQMYSEDFVNPGYDDCNTSNEFDDSYVYKIRVDDYKIVEAVKVGSVPKYVALSPSGDKVLVTNWCSGDLSIINTKNSTELKRIEIGRHPRGIVVDKNGELVYVAVMGGAKIVVINLRTMKVVKSILMPGAPRHLCISNNDNFLYVTLSRAGKVIKYDLRLNKVVAEIRSGRAPRSMVLSKDGRFVFVVNYISDLMTVHDTKSLEVLASIETNHHPIGVAFDDVKNRVWVACYSGSIQIFNISTKTAKQKTAYLAKPINKIKNNKKEYLLVVGVYSSAANASRMIQRLESQGLNGFSFKYKESMQAVCAFKSYDENDVTFFQKTKLTGSFESWVFVK